MKQSETFSRRSFFEHIHLMTVICSHISSVTVPYQNILYRGSIYSSFPILTGKEAISKLSDAIEGFYFFKLQHDKITP